MTWGREPHPAGYPSDPERSKRLLGRPGRADGRRLRGKTREEALANLDEAVALHEGAIGESIDTPAEERAVLEEPGIDPDEVEAAREENDELPEVVR